MSLIRTVFLFVLLSLLTLSTAISSDKVRLIIRGDDLGMSQGSLEAVERSFNQGILTCTSILVPGPWFEGAAELCKKNPGWCTGVHLCLIAEWRGMRWRPVLPWDRVPSIVDEDGFLYTYPDELFAKKPNLKEIDAEFRAQIDLALKKGINVQYIDTHYMSPRDLPYPGLKEVIDKISRDYNLPVSGYFEEQSGLSLGDVPIAQRLSLTMQRMEKLEPGLYLWVCHPGNDSPEHDALIHSARDHVKIEGVGPRRAEVTRILTSLELKSMVMKKDIELTDYKKLWLEKKY
ncbi:MAG: ChbG/HpnK family deacetylase [Chloroflexi bacterium]|jgi:chitin disaccharide deacetylase|nr:ChbG/HpnK family deacetylase [Chloroflexota bacterium]